MATVVFQLNGYKVVTGIPMMKPYGHLFIEYWLEGNEQEARIFRGGPEGVFLKIRDTLEAASRDSHRQIETKGSIFIKEQRLLLKVNELHKNNAILAFGNFVNMLNDILKVVNRHRSVYGVVVNNSNSIAYETWRLITKDEPYSDIKRSKYRFIGAKFLARRKLLVDQFDHSLLG